MGHYASEMGADTPYIPSPEVIASQRERDAEIHRMCMEALRLMRENSRKMEGAKNTEQQVQPDTPEDCEKCLTKSCPSSVGSKCPAYRLT